MTSQQSRQEKEEEIAEQQAPVASGSGLSREELVSCALARAE